MTIVDVLVLIVAVTGWAISVRRVTAPNRDVDFCSTVWEYASGGTRAADSLLDAKHRLERSSALPALVAGGIAGTVAGLSTSLPSGATGSAGWLVVLAIVVVASSVAVAGLCAAITGRTAVRQADLVRGTR